ncbi:hypothetical protein ONZ45_g10247 [Pleurotus djamor]|nr:hypothetical protein ONZ45_g10247 [Pleurotus djamor]
MLAIAGIIIFTVITFGVNHRRAEPPAAPIADEAASGLGSLMPPPADTAATAEAPLNMTVVDAALSGSGAGGGAQHAIADASGASTSQHCFPSLGFQMPSSVPPSTNGWWCDVNSEYAFLGFSYAVNSCQSISQMKKEFRDIRNTFNGRYIRVYSACDRDGFYNDLIDAAWEAGIGVYALIWFGFDGDNIYRTRRNTLFSILHSNPRAQFVVRAVQFGSEPLYDWVMTATNLANEVNAAKRSLGPLGIRVIVSEMAYGYQIHDDSHAVMDAQDFVAAHMLPYFSEEASTGSQAWPIVKKDLDWFTSRANGKKIIFSQNGWPSTTSPGVEPNSQAAVADIQNEREYAQLLDIRCPDLKAVNPGGVGWFWHLYSDSQTPGYGVYNTRGTLKFPFKPRTSC